MKSGLLEMERQPSANFVCSAEYLAVPREKGVVQRCHVAPPPRYSGRLLRPRSTPSRSRYGRRDATKTPNDSRNPSVGVLRGQLACHFEGLLRATTHRHVDIFRQQLLRLPSLLSAR